MLQLALPDIKHLEALARKDERVISFSQGGLKLEVPFQVKEAVRSILSSSTIDYYGLASGITPLRDKIAADLSTTYNTTITRDHIHITHGCSGALSTLTLTLLAAGDEVILPEPTYPGYENIVKIAKAHPIFVPLYNDHNDDETLTLEHIKGATNSKTKMLIIANPSNPTGRLIEKATIEAIIEWCESHSIYCVMDEVYENYVFDSSFDSITPYIPHHKYLIRVSSFSKNAAMSGWRIGYMVIPPTIFNAVHAVADAIFISPSVIGQYAALAVLEHPEAIEGFHHYVKRNRDYTVQRLGALAEKNIISFHKPEAAFYLFIKTHEKNSSARCYDILDKAKVAVVPGKAFGPHCGSYIRLCYARTFDVLEEGLDRLVTYWNTPHV